MMFFVGVVLKPVGQKGLSAILVYIGHSSVRFLAVAYLGFV